MASTLLRRSTAHPPRRAFAAAASAAVLSGACAVGCGDAHLGPEQAVPNLRRPTRRHRRRHAADSRNRTAVPNPALCFELAPRSGANGTVDVKVVEYLPPYLTRAERVFYKPRPHPLRLAMLRASDNDWTTGRTLSFQQHQRVFLVGVVLPDGIPDGARRTIEAILDSLRIEPRGTCAPTAGVGSSR
jgi:hypothetical protein